LQIKCWSEFDKASWADGPPLYVQVQTQIEMLVTGCKWGAVAVMFGSQSLERFFVEPNEAFLDAALAVLRDFYTCLELRQPPPIDGSAATTRALARLHPDDNGLAVQLPSDADSLLAKLRRVKSLSKRCDERRAAIENQLKAAIGANTYGVTADGQCVSACEIHLPSLKE
jgi:predicted phage-related endonuclease